MNRFLNIWLWLTVIAWVGCWSAWMFFGKELFEVGQAFTIFGFCSSVFLDYRKILVAQIAFTIAINQILDELFFNPFTVSWNEYTTVGVLILLILAKHYKLIITKKKSE